MANGLKARVSTAGIGERPHLCVQIAEHQLTEADKLYTAAEVDEAQTKLTDVVAYSELARDYAIQSHKYQKQTEIAVRVMTRKLTEVLHALTHDDQAPVRPEQRSQQPPGPPPQQRAELAADLVFLL